MQETCVWTLHWEDPLEEGMVAHSSILAGELPWIEVPGGQQSMGSQRVGYDWVTKHSTAAASLPQRSFPQSPWTIITPSSCPISFSCLALSTPVVLNVSSTCMWSLWDQGLSPLLCSLQYPQFYKHDQHPVMLSEYFLTGILYHFISKIILPSSQESWLQSSVCWPRHKTQTLPLFVKNKH